MTASTFTSTFTGAYVRVTNTGDHHVQCDRHGVISWHIRSYRLALAAARAHVCTDVNSTEGK